MGNQLSLDDKDLYYLGGLFDGEGSIMLVRTGNISRINPTRPIVPQVRLTNTDPTLIQFVVDMCVKLGAKPWIETRSQKKNWNTAYSILVSGIKKTNKVLSVLQHYLLAKKEQARLVLEFNDIRIKGYTALVHQHGHPYGEAELSIFNKVKILNHRGLTETGDGKYQLVHNWFDIQDSPPLDESLEI